jgi:plasmid segregation protein ParM
MSIVGLDVGYSNLKLAVGVPGDAPRVLVRPAGAAPLARLGERLAAGAGSEAAVRVEVAGTPWAAAIEPVRFEGWQRALHEDYTASPAFRALVEAALELAGEARIARLVTGLPVAQAQEPRRREALRRVLLGEHHTPNGRVVVADVHIVPQPVGAFVDLLCSGADAELLARLEEGTVLVLDAGYYSVDWALIVAGELRRGASGTSLEAMSVLIERAAARLAERHGGRAQPLALEAALRRGRTHLAVFGQRIALAPLLEATAGEVAAVALEALRQALRREVSNVDLVLLAGGGAALYAPGARSAFPYAEVRLAPEPVAANARGFFHYGAH